MSKYKTPEIDTTTSRPRFMGDVKVVRDGKEITLENVQFFTYYADDDAEKENKPTVAFDFAVEPIEKNVGTVLGETFTQTCSMAKPCGHLWCGLFRADLHSTICQVLLVLLQLSLRLHQWDFKQASEMQSITFFS